MIKAIFFDLDDTLYNQVSPFAAAHEQLFAKRFPDIPINDLFISSRKHSDVVYIPSLTGEISMEEMYIYRVKHAYADFNAEISDKEALEFQYIYADGQKHLQLTPFLAEKLQLLRQKFILGVITNGTSEHQWDKINAMNLTEYFPRETIIVSGDINIQKPEAGIFHHAEKVTNCQPEEMIMVGDSIPSDLVGAKKAGWNMLWLRRRNMKLSTNLEFQPDWIADNEEEMINILCGRK